MSVYIYETHIYNNLKGTRFIRCYDYCTYTAVALQTSEDLTLLTSNTNTITAQLSP